MNYIKVIDGIKHCKPLSKIVIISNDMQIFNPTEEMVIKDGWVKETSEIIELSEEEHEINEKNSEIIDLKDNLCSSDYKIIKCMEAFLCNEELPYNINDLHIERNNLRAKINNLE